MKQVLVLAMTTYRLLVWHCMVLLGLQPPEELTGKGVAMAEDEMTEERS